jgi:hypothetical protein
MMELGPMTAIFEAAKTGNLEELKKVENLHEVDKYGNTALLWAACHGQLEIVKWLLSAEGGAKIDARNDKGNTALLLAAAFGHLETVKWLLSKEVNPAVFWETNNQQNTALIQAAVNGQLHVVDYLIRQYYLGQSLAKEERQRLDLLTKDKAIRTYLGVFKILSQKTVDYSELIPVLEKASQRLQKEELSFIYLICFWMQVHSKAEALPGVIEGVSKEPFMNKLLASHQHELLEHMFYTGYLLADWSINEGQLTFTHIIDSQLSIKIKAQLDKSDNDIYLWSIASVIERDTLYIDCYLKPVYRSLVLAGQDNIANALKDPYTYHLNTHKESLVEDDVAKWTAYHLCQRLDTSLETHQKAYAQTAGSSRLAYYKTVKQTTLRDITLQAEYAFCLKPEDLNFEAKNVYLKLMDGGLQYTVLMSPGNPAVGELPAVGEGEILNSQLGIKLTSPLDLNQLEPITSGILELISNNGHIPLQKKALLLSLGNVPAPDGERLYWTKEYPHWLQSLSQGFSAGQEKQNTLTLIGQEEPIQMRDDLSQQIWDSELHKPRPLKLPGNHPVYKLTLFKGQDVYCKLYPGLPGINDELHYLYRRVFGATQGLPWSVTGLLKIDNQTIPVLLSEDAGSRIEDNDERLENLDSYTLSKLILFTILTNLEDAKPDNNALTTNARGFYDIYSIDHDQGLVESTKEAGFLFFRTKKISVKSLLFCLDAMNKPLDKRAVEEFLAIKPMDTLKAWLKDLILVAKQYGDLFSEYPDPSKVKDPYRRSYMQIVLPIAIVIRIAYKLQYMHAALKDGSELVPQKLLQKLESEVAAVYEPKLQQSLSATKRFDELAKEWGWYDWCAETKTYSTTITLSKELFESFVPDKKAEVVSPAIALEALEEINRKWEKLEEELVKAMKGEMDQFSKLLLEEQQTLLKQMRLDQLSDLKRKFLLKTLSQRKDFTDLYIRYPQFELTNSLFSSLVKNNTKLQHLSITNALALTSISSLNSAKSLTHLKLSQLPQVKELIVTLDNVTDLTLSDIPELTTVEIIAPNLRCLHIIDLPDSGTASRSGDLSLRSK